MKGVESTDVCREEESKVVRNTNAQVRYTQYTMYKCFVTCHLCQGQILKQKTQTAWYDYETFNNRRWSTLRSISVSFVASVLQLLQTEVRWVIVTWSLLWEGNVENNCPGYWFKFIRLNDARCHTLPLSNTHTHTHTQKHWTGFPEIDNNPQIRPLPLPCPGRTGCSHPEYKTGKTLSD